jgi:hypothetical protein
MPLVFKVTKHEPPKLTLEAAPPSTQCDHTICTVLPEGTNRDALQLELDLFPAVEDDTLRVQNGDHIRLIHLRARSKRQLVKDTEEA